MTLIINKTLKKIELNYLKIGRLTFLILYLIFGVTEIVNKINWVSIINKKTTLVY